MGSLDPSTGSNRERKIKIINVSGQTPDQIETLYNDNYGKKGWVVKQIVVLGGAPYVLAEKEE